MSDFLKEDNLYYVYAEYNPYWVYMGWWLYAIPVDNLTNERDMEKWEQATWIHYDWRLEALFEGLGLPKWKSFATCDNFRPDPSDYCRPLMRKYPAGVVCQVKGDGREFIPQKSPLIGDYLRIVHQRQLNHIAKAQEEKGKTEANCTVE